MIEAQDRASAALNAVAASLGRLEQQAGRTGASFPKIAGGMAVGTVAAHAFMGAVQGVVGGLAGMGKGAIDLASRLEQAKIGFTTMLGGAQQADAFIRKLQDFAETTAFSFPGIQAAAQRFLAMGIDAKNVIPIIKDVSNALSSAGKGGDTDALQRVGASLAEIQAQGKITGEQLRELARNGIAVMPMLAAAFGKTTAEIRRMAEDGEISADMFFEAFHSQVAKLGDIGEQQAKTWAVAITNVQDILGRMTVETLEEFFGALTRGALLLQDFLKSDRAAAWADDMKQAIHAVMVALEPLGAALQAAMGLPAGGPSSTTSKVKAAPPVSSQSRDNWRIPETAIKSAKEYDAQIKAATADIHAATAELTGLTAQQDALKIKIEDTTKRYELQLIGLKDQLEANNAEIDKTKTLWEGVIAPLERTQAQLGRLADDTKADFAAIMDPFKSQLDGVNRKIQDSKAAFEATVKPIESQISAIDKANAALTKQRNLVNEIADLALRQKSLQALGDPALRADLAGKLKLNELNRNELEWEKELIELKTKKDDIEKATRGVDKQLDANTRERIGLERQLQGAADKGLLAQVEKQGVLNDAKKEQTDIDLANAKIAADAQRAPLEDQLADAKAELATLLDPLELQAAGLSRAIENVAAAEAAALAPIIAAQSSVARQIEDANQAMKDALAPLEAAQKGIAAQIKEVEAAQSAALAPLKEQMTELDRQHDALELHKKQIQDKINLWKDEQAEIKKTAEEAAKVAKALDLSGGEEQGAGPVLDPRDRGIVPPAINKGALTQAAEGFKELAKQVQASADAFNNLNVATSGGLVGSLGELGKIIGTFVITGVVVGWLGKLAGGLRGLVGPAGLARLALTGVLVVVSEHLPQIQAALKILGDDFNTFFNGQQRNIDVLKQNWTIFFNGLLTPVNTFIVDWNKGWSQMWADWDRDWAKISGAPSAGLKAFTDWLGGGLTEIGNTWNGFWIKVWADWDRDWAKISGAPYEGLNAFIQWLGGAFNGWKTGWWDVAWKGIWDDWDRDWALLSGAPKVAWDAFVAWIQPSLAAVVTWIDPIAAAFKGIGDAIANLPKALPDWWSQRPGWLGGTGGQQTSLGLPQAGGIHGDALSLSGGGAGGLQGDTLLAYVKDQFGAALGEEAGRVAAAVALTEGGLHGAAGDYNEGGSPSSFGVFQFHGPGGQLDNFANWLNTSLEEAANIATARPDIAVKYALENYLGRAITAGLEAGLSGPALATYAQDVGQVSVSPERAGQAYNSLFGAGGSMPQTTVDLSGGTSMQNQLLTIRDLTSAQHQFADSTTIVQQAQDAAAAATARARAGLEGIMTPTQAAAAAQLAAANTLGTGVPAQYAAGMQSAAAVVVGAATVVNGQVITALAPPVEAVAAVGSGVVNGLAVVLRNGVPVVVDASTVVGTEIVQALAPIPEAAGQIGEQVPEAMAEGIRDGTGDVVDSIKDLVDKAMDAWNAGDFQGVRDAFNLKMPPVQGHAQGGVAAYTGLHWLERGERVLTLGESARSFRSSRSGGAGGGGGGISGPITINISGDRDPRETARLVRDELIKIGRNNGGRVL